MCTLIVIYRRVPGRWLVVAANRDEYLDRPSEGPALRTGSEIPLLAPMDTRAGGTWLGLNQEGVFSALTNLRDPDPDASRTSRGRVVMNALAARTAEAAAESLMGIEAGAHNPFNAFVADREKAYLVGYREEPVLYEIEPGVCVVGNLDIREPGSAPGPPSKVDRVGAQAEEIARRPAEEVLDGLGELCRSHAQSTRSEGSSSLEDVCVHVGQAYGTRSSILLELSDVFFEPGNRNLKRETGGSGNQAGTEGYQGDSRLFYAAGSPCVAPFEDFSPLLKELRQSPSYPSAEFS